MISNSRGGLALGGVLFIVILAACSTTNKKLQAPELMFLDHPLVDKIWDVAEQRFVEKGVLFERVLASDFILLGETHDNASHHQAQAWVIDALKTVKRDVGVAFEMITGTQFESLGGEQITTSSKLIKLLNQEKNGWDYALNYRVVFDSVINAQFDFYPANVNRQQIFKIVNSGFKHAPPGIEKLVDNNPFNNEQKERLHNDIKDSHCGMLTGKMAPYMVKGQRLKDAVMSLALLENAKHDAMVLVAGSGHTRNDRAVPMYLGNENPQAKVVSIAWLEVDTEGNNVDFYRNMWGMSQLPFDFVWFTARVDRPDPCEMLRKHPETLKSKSQ